MGLESKIGPNTAGLAQRMKNKYSPKYEEQADSYLERNYVPACSINQF